MVLFLFFCTSNGLALDASARNHPGLPLFGVEDMVKPKMLEIIQFLCLDVLSQITFLYVLGVSCEVFSFYTDFEIYERQF